MTKFPGKLMQTYEETGICADGNTDKHSTRHSSLQCFKKIW